MHLNKTEKEKTQQHMVNKEEKGHIHSWIKIITKI